MDKKKCIVLFDFLGCAGITIKKGTICEILKDEKDFLWINAYVDEIGEEIPFPIYKNYVHIINH